jgi:phenylacetate-CoA ligase
MWVAGIPIIRALENMGVLTIPAGAEAGTERFLQIADLMKPTVLACTPSFAMFLIEEAPKTIKKEVKELGIKKIFCAGEPGAGLPDVKKKIEEAYDAVIYDAAGVAWGLMNISCGTEEYHGMHIVTEDYNLMYDLVDPETNKPIPIENGAVGRGVISQLEWEAAPILRYDLGDICQVYTDPCPCGLPGYRLKVLGRSDDMLIVKGINVYPAAIKNVVNSFVPKVTGEMRIMLDAPPPRVVPPLKIKVEHAPDSSKDELPSLKKTMEEKISREVRTRPVVELVPPNTLKRAMEMGRQKTPLIEIVE